MTESYTYDAPGVTDGTRIKEYIYDAQGNKEKVIFRMPDGSVADTMYYQYDESGNLIKEVDATGSWENSFVYDGEGRVVKETRVWQWVGDVILGMTTLDMVTLDKIYDAEGNLTDETETTVQHYQSGGTSTSVRYLKYFYE